MQLKIRHILGGLLVGSILCSPHGYASDENNNNNNSNNDPVVRKKRRSLTSGLLSPRGAYMQRKADKKSLKETRKRSNTLGVGVLLSLAENGNRKKLDRSLSEGSIKKDPQGSNQSNSVDALKGSFKQFTGEKKEEVLRQIKRECNLSDVSLFCRTTGKEVIDTELIPQFFTLEDILEMLKTKSVEKVTEQYDGDNNYQKIKVFEPTEYQKQWSIQLKIRSDVFSDLTRMFFDPTTKEQRKYLPPFYLLPVKETVRLGDEAIGREEHVLGRYLLVQFVEGNNKYETEDDVYAHDFSIWLELRKLRKQEEKEELETI